VKTIEDLLFDLSKYGAVEIEVIAATAWYVRVCLEGELHSPFVADTSLWNALNSLNDYCGHVYSE